MSKENGTIIAVNTAKEELKMVRKAEEIKSIYELNIPDSTKAFLERKFGSLDEIIRYGRAVAYGSGSKMPPKKYETELASALEEAGLVRPRTDFALTFRIAKLYGKIFPEHKTDFVTHTYQLSNEQYENFVGVSKRDVEELKNLISHFVTEKQYKVICRRFGLDYNTDQDYASVSKLFGMQELRVRKHEDKAFRNLNSRVSIRYFPKLCHATKEAETTIEDMRKELEEIHKDPIFEKERKLLDKLRRYQNLPYNRNTPKWTLDKDIECLRVEKLPIRIVNSLRNAGINTIFDIIYLDNWNKIENLPEKDFKNLKQKMASIGYEI